MKSDRCVNGYKLIYLPEHHLSMNNDNWDGYVYEHIIIMEQSIGRSITLDEEVHHLDGDRSNNRISNLIVLDKSQHKRLHSWINGGCVYNGSYGVCVTKQQLNTCIVCGSSLTTTDQEKYCSHECSNIGQRKTERPSKSELKYLIENNSWVSIGRMFDVSDNAVRKWAKNYNIAQ